MPKTSSNSTRIAAKDALPHAKRIQFNGPTMNTRWAVQCDIDSSLDLTALHRNLSDGIDQVDRQMSLWKPESDLVRLNQAAPDVWVELPREILEVLTRAQQIGEQSAGAFDPSVGELVSAWGFGAAQNTPDPAAIRIAAQGLGHPAHQWLELDLSANRACKRTPMQLDLCGIAKGYAVDRMISILRQHGVLHALASLDGELRALGAQASGEPWAIALESPQAGLRTTHGVLELVDLAVATSGDYRRWVQIGDVRLSHTMDGRKRAPVNNAITSVTVLADDCMSADAWATALLVAGPDEGSALAEQRKLDALFLLRPSPQQHDAQNAKRRENPPTELRFGRFAA